jgi:DNA-binding NarL/FixJ family response regulator
MTYKACIIWPGSHKTKTGYPTTSMKVNGKWKTVNVHRKTYIENIGPIPDGMIVMHVCDNRKCINPAHLALGTHQQNMDDMVKKGRSWKPKGSTHPASKLTEANVKIIKYSSSHLNNSQIAKQFNVKRETIRDIRNGKRWKHI